MSEPIPIFINFDTYPIVFTDQIWSSLCGQTMELPIDIDIFIQESCEDSDTPSPVCRLIHTLRAMKGKMSTHEAMTEVGKLAFEWGCSMEW